MKKLRLSWIVLLSSLLLPSLASAEFRYEVSARDAKRITPVYRERLESLFRSTEALLPDAYKSEITRPIQVSFKKLNANGFDLSRFCEGGYRVAQTSASGAVPSVVLEQGLLEILALPEDRRAISCGHRDLNKLLQAALIHETSHIFDQTRPLSDAEFSDLRDCRSRENSLATGGASAPPVSPHCQYLGTIRHRISDRVLFRKLFDLHQKDVSRSPDPYEYANAQESLAVNMEYLLLDPEYGCRQPARAQFLRGELGMPAPNLSCTQSRFVVSGRDGSRIDLDPSRVYQIHYLLAEPGKELMSRWGHAMVRLVLCNPSRREVGPECLKDLSHHVVLSYRANVDDLVTSYWKGVQGGYRSQLYVLPLSSVLTEYNRAEKRDVSSFPVAFSEEEKRRFVDHALEQFWSYVGTYRYVSNNCASETYKLLSGALSEETHPLFSFPAPNTPTGLKQTLAEAGLLNENSLSEEEKVRGGLLFRSNVDRDLNASIAYLKSVLGMAIPELEGFLASSADQRRDWYEMAIRSESRSRVAGAFLILEIHIDRLFKEALKKDLSKALESEQDAKFALAEFREMSASLAVNRYSTPGYGIPLEGEVDLERLKSAVSDFMSRYSDLSVLVDGKNGPKSVQQKRIQENIDFFFQSQFGGLS